MQTHNHPVLSLQILTTDSGPSGCRPCSHRGPRPVREECGTWRWEWGRPPQGAGSQTLKTLPLVVTAPFSSFQRFVWGPRGRRTGSFRNVVALAMPCRRSPIPRAAAECGTLKTLKRARARAQPFSKFSECRPPAGLAGIETWKAGKGRWHHDYLSFLNFASGPWAGGETLINKLKTVAAPPFSKCSKFRPGQEPAPGGPTLKTSKRTNKTIIV